MERLEVVKKRHYLKQEEKYHIFVEIIKSDGKGGLEEVLRKYGIDSGVLYKIKQAAEEGAREALKGKKKCKEKELKRLKSLVSKQAEEIKLKDAQITLYKNLNEDLNTIIEGLKYTRIKLIQAEKISALKTFTADVCYNLLTSLGRFARRLNKKVSEETENKECCKAIITELDRLENILS